MHKMKIIFSMFYFVVFLFVCLFVLEIDYYHLISSVLSWNYNTNRNNVRKSLAICVTELAGGLLLKILNSMLTFSLPVHTGRVILSIRSTYEQQYLENGKSNHCLYRNVFKTILDKPSNGMQVDILFISGSQIINV